jgi:hypothetical protein
MVPTYNGWEDTPEDEREALDLWEAVSEPKVESRKSKLIVVVAVESLR